MPYVDNGQKFTDIGHCRTCRGQWVVTANLRGKTGNDRHTYSGKVCPYCKNSSVRYTKEDNR
jgi:hypothetical protein